MEKSKLRKVMAENSGCPTSEVFHLLRKSVCGAWFILWNIGGYLKNKHLVTVSSLSLESSSLEILVLRVASLFGAWSLLACDIL